MALAARFGGAEALAVSPQDCLIASADGSRLAGWLAWAEAEMDYDEARRRAVAAVDAFNRRDLDALQVGLHEEMTHQAPLADRHLGQEDGRIEGKQAHGEFVRWLWAQEPQLRSVLEEVFTGPHGYAYLVRREDNGGQAIFVHEMDADGLVRSLRVFSSPPAG